MGKHNSTVEQWGAGEGPDLAQGHSLNSTSFLVDANTGTISYNPQSVIGQLGYDQ